MPSSLRSTQARAAHLVERGRHVGRRRGEHRPDRPPRHQPEGVERLPPPVSAAAGHLARRRGEHRGPPDGGDRDAGRLGDRRRAAPSPGRPGGGSRRPAPGGTAAPPRSPARTAPRPAAPAPPASPLPAVALIRSSSPSTSSGRQGGLVGRRRQHLEPPPAEPGPALPRGAGEVARHDLDLVGAGRPQHAGDDRRPWRCATTSRSARRTPGRGRGAASAHRRSVSDRW